MNDRIIKGINYQIKSFTTSLGMVSVALLKFYAVLI